MTTHCVDLHWLLVIRSYKTSLGTREYQSLSLGLGRKCRGFGLGKASTETILTEFPDPNTQKI